MASNNSGPNKFVPEGGGGWKKSAPQKPRRSAKPLPNHGSDRGDVVRYLKELFIQVIDEEIIETVAESCGWNVDVAIDSLFELSGDVTFSARNNNSPGLRDTMNRNSPGFAGSPRANQSRGFEQPKKNNLYKAPRPVQTTAPTSPAMAAIKVNYQGYDEDSDDADIIIEDEEEFELVKTKSEDQIVPSPTDKHSGSWQGSGTALSPNSPFTDVKRAPKECPELVTIRNYVTNGNRILVLMRGCPGSGKSHLAHTLVTMYIGANCDPSSYIFSTDSYFSRSSKYVFAPPELPTAHEWNQKRVTIEMQKGFSPIIIDNTNTTVWEMKPYARLAVQYGYAVQLLEPTTPWCWQESELARRNSHGVARHTIRNMMDRYEKVGSAELLNRLKLKYSRGCYPPQPCANPVANRNTTNSAKETERNARSPVVQPQSRAAPMYLSDLEKLIVKPSKNIAVANIIQVPPVVGNAQGINEQSLNLFTNLKPLTQASAPMFTKTESVQPLEPVVKEDVARDISVSELLAESESLHSLVSVQDSIGWQLIESLDDALINNNLDPASPSKASETTFPDLEKNEGLMFDVDYAPSKELLEEMEEVTIIAEDGRLEMHVETESVEKVLGDTFDEVFNLPFSELEREVDVELNDELGIVVSDSETSPDMDNSINTCLEYVLVGPGDSLTYQRSHEDFDKTTRDVVDKVVESVLAEDSVDDVDGDIAQGDSLNLPGEDTKSVEGTSKRGRGRGKVVVGVLETEKIETSKDKMCVDDFSKQGYPSFVDALPEEIMTPNTLDERDNAEGEFQTPSGSPEPKSLEANYLSSRSGDVHLTTKSKDSSQTADTKVVIPEKPSTKMDLFSWFFTKIKSPPDLVESNSLQSRTDANILLPTNKDINSMELASESSDLPIQSQTNETPVSADNSKWPLTSSWPPVELASECSDLPIQSQTNETPVSADNSKWQLTSSWAHSTVEGGDNVEESYPAAGTMGSSATGEDISRGTTVQITNEPLIYVEDNSLDNLSIEQLETEKTVANNKPSEENSESVQVDGTTEEPLQTDLSVHHVSNMVGATDCEPLVEIMAQPSIEDDLNLFTKPDHLYVEKNMTENTTYNIKQPSDETSVPCACTSDEDNCAVPSFVLESLNSFQTDFSLLEADISNIAKESPNDTDEKTVPSLLTVSLAHEVTSVSDDADPSSDLKSVAQPLEENISGRLGSQDYQYTSAWSKMSPSNLLQDEEVPTTSQPTLNVPFKVPTKDSETNTSYIDFSLIEQECMAENVQYLSGRSRSINMGRMNKILRSVPTISTLDKGSMTAPEDFDSEQPDFELLVNMFPKIARDSLKELFEKCNCEINWTVNLLIDSGHALEPSENFEFRFNNTDDLEETQKLFEELDMHDMRKSVETEMNNSVTRGFETDDPTSLPTEADGSSSDGASKTQSPSKKGNKKQTSELSLRLKKEMEKNIDLSDSSYSEETLRLKKIRHGQPNVASSPEPSGQDIAENSDWLRDPDQDEEEEGMIPLTLDAELLAQLQSHFGELTYPYPEGVTPTVELPLSLARQIHSVVMESQQRQFDMQEKYFEDMIKDEEYARRIQAEQMPPPDFRQIMDMELALELYKADSRGAETQDDMATRLSKRKLAELFPTVDPEMLMDVFAAHENSFQDTLEVLEASTGQPEEAVRNVLSPEALIQYEKQLIDKAKQESIKQREVERERASTSSAFEKNENSRDQALEKAKFYREEASRQYQLRNACYQQSNAAMRNGQPLVASYYAQVGQLYKQFIEKANARAAASLLTAHTLKHTTSTTLDLHYLFVVEALQALDIFIDHHISRLVDMGRASRQLFLITGGGNHSVGGRPKIKPAVQRRLTQRGIRFSELNHGQLKIVVTRHMALSNGN